MNDGALHELSGGWVWATVGELYDIVGGGTPSTSIAEYWEGDIPWITSADIHGLKDIRPRKQITKKAIGNSATNLVPNGSLIVVTRVGLGKIAMTNTPLCFSQDSQALIGNNSMLFPFYSLYYLSKAVQIFKYEHRGTTIAGVTKKQLSELAFLLPPFPEQRAIVSKIEQLFSDLDNGIENFKKAQAQLKLYRQSVLKAACEGKLVPTEAELARSEGRDYESADMLLARILEERREKWNGKGKYKEPVAPDTSGLPELPEGWKWVSMDQISNLVTDGDHNPPKRVASGIPHLTAKNIRNWQISEEGCTYIIEQDFEKVCKRYLPIRGDIIITCVGTIGRTAIVPKNYIFSADRNLAVVRLISEGLTEKLLQFYLNTPAAQNSMNTASGSTAQPHLYLGKIRVFPVPLPPLAEQLRIVIEVERRLSICDKMEATITESLQKAESLRQSILKKAFEGKLLNEKELEEVRNAPDWEPAEKLLERIKAEKTNMKAKKKGKK